MKTDPRVDSLRPDVQTPSGPSKGKAPDPLGTHQIFPDNAGDDQNGTEQGT